MFGGLTRDEVDEIRVILTDRIPYYNGLSDAAQKKFFSRLIRFIKSKRFIGKEGLKITPEILVMVGAAAIQLTFGLEKYVIAHFKVIMMFPGTFHFRLLNKDLKGGASPRGTLWLSWEAFQHGYEVPDDKRNLGLHEMAHALKLDVLKGHEFDKAFASYFDDWSDVSSGEFRKMKKGESSFLRKYGGTNRMEFFAVAVEHFFEAPEEFQKELPDIYNHLCVLLNQNPLNVRGDFELTTSYIKKANLRRRKFPLPEKILLRYEYAHWHWTYSLTVLGIMYAIPMSVAMFEKTRVTYEEIGFLIAVAVTVGGILHYPILSKIKGGPFSFFPLYLILGCAPIVCTALLQLNYAFELPGLLVETHTVTRQSWVGGRVIYTLEDRKYDDHEEFRTYKRPSRMEVQEPYLKLRLFFKKGLLGYWIIESRELIRPPPEEKGSE